MLMGWACGLAIYRSLLDAVAYEVQYLVSSDVQFLLGGVILPHVPSKDYISDEALQEIVGVQEYVAALASYDQSGSGTLFIGSAFDLNAGDAGSFYRGLVDLRAFFSPAQSHVHLLSAHCPVQWGAHFLFVLLAKMEKATLEALFKSKTKRKPRPMNLQMQPK